MNYAESNAGNLLKAPSIFKTLTGFAGWTANAFGHFCGIFDKMTQQKQEACDFFFASPPPTPPRGLI